MDDHDKGLLDDVKTLADMAERRRVLLWLAGATVLPAFGCAGGVGAGSAGTGGQGGSSQRFDISLFVRHREYRAAIGVAFVLALIAARYFFRI